MPPALVVMMFGVVARCRNTAACGRRCIPSGPVLGFCSAGSNTALAVRHMTEISPPARYERRSGNPNQQ